MTDETANLILEHLRAIRTDVLGLRDEVRQMKERVNALEIATAGLTSAIAGMRGDIAHQWTVLDRHDERLKRLETRAGLIEEHDPT